MQRPALSLTSYRVRMNERRRPTLPPALLAEAGITTALPDVIATSWAPVVRR